MQLVVEMVNGRHDVELTPAGPGVTVADLAAALGLVASAELTVDGSPARPDLSLDEAGVVNGCLLTVSSSQSDPDMATATHLKGLKSRDSDVEVAVVGGLDTGTRHHPSVGVLLTVGRRSDSDVCVDDPTVSPLHARLEIAHGGCVVHDVASHNGVRVDGVAVVGRTEATTGQRISVGASEIVMRPAPADDRPTGTDPRRHAVDGTLAFNRPPRLRSPPPVHHVRVPDLPAEATRRSAFSFVAMLGPLVMGVVMVQLLGNIRYALFALMSPVMMITNVVASRRRNRRDAKISARAFRSELARFCADLADAAEAERRHLDVLLPDMAEIVRRATMPSTRLWERRHHHGDHLRLIVGRGRVAWDPPVDTARSGTHPDIEAAVTDASVIDRCALAVDLSAGNVVGVVGDRPAALALVRGLVAQAAVLHGPADVPMAVLVSAEHALDWEWTKWLPHTAAVGAAGRRLSGDSRLSSDLLKRMLDGEHESTGTSVVGAHDASMGPTLLLVVDDVGLTLGRNAPARAVLRGGAGPCAGVVLAPTADLLPAMCTAVVDLVDALGDAVVEYPGSGRFCAEVSVAGISDRTARRCAQALARFDDPEVSSVAANVPSVVGLLDVLGVGDSVAAEASRRWSALAADPPLSVPIGVGPDGVVEFDLVADGPHMLVGGTTGSGKSEFLRSLTAALAHRLTPDHVVFVLIDYKGGSAFAECASLPHTVGIVTDLDEHLGERALRSLEAELRRRECVLRDAAAADLAAYRCAGSPDGPMPRLVLVVDEFATLAAELPDFMGALVNVAQRGRSLGVHMVLATQRPSGAVNANIKANTNIRVALRVQGVQDSHDIIDSPDAAAISRTQPGRAYVRLGHGDVMAVQTAFSSGRSRSGGATGVRVAPFRFGQHQRLVEEPLDRGPSDLSRVVAGCGAAAQDNGGFSPRRPWLEMLPDMLEIDDVLQLGSDLEPTAIPLGVGDDPATQSRPVVAWNPGEGHLGLFGAVGSGTTSSLVTLAVAAVARRTSAELHMYAIDFGGGGLAALHALPHCGGVVGAGERERQVRVLRLLSDELERRRSSQHALGGLDPQVVVLVDGLPALLASFEGLDGQDPLDQLRRLLSDGPAVGLTLAFTAERLGAVPVRLMSAVTTRLAFRQADAADFSAIGLRPRELPGFVPGRAIDARTRLVVQIGHVVDPTGRCTGVGDRGQVAGPLPWVIEALPEMVCLASLPPTPAGESGRLFVPLGLGDSDRGVAGLELRPGEHVLVAGPAGSGVTATLRLIAATLAEADPAVVRVAVCCEGSALGSSRSLFDGVGSPEQLHRVLEVAAQGDGRRWLVVVDDVHLIEEAGRLEDLARAGERCRLVVGGRADMLHGNFGHWTRLVRRGGTGVLLQPRLDTDGDLLGVRLPRTVSAPLVPGRGFVVRGGTAALIQVADITETAA